MKQTDESDRDTLILDWFRVPLIILCFNRLFLRYAFHIPFLLHHLKMCACECACASYRMKPIDHGNGSAAQVQKPIRLCASTFIGHRIDLCTDHADDQTFDIES